MSNLFLQIFVALCFLGLVIVLFFEKTDYLTYSVLLIIIAGTVSALLMPEKVGNIDFFVDSIDWEVVFFLIGMFTIVEVLVDQRIFQEISRRIVNKYKHSYRKMFYALCVVSTLIAALLEDLSVAIIFGPIIVMACAQLKINPTPFLLGMTICINLASTLTPFGSAEDVLIVNALDLDFLWFMRWFLLYFIVATLLTLFLLDKTILKKSLLKKWDQYCSDDVPNYVEEEIDTEDVPLPNSLNNASSDDGAEDASESQETIDESGEGSGEPYVFYTPVEQDTEQSLSDVRVDPKVFKKNLIGLVVFVVLLIAIPTLYLPCLISALMFVFMNPVEDGGHKHPSLSYYFKRVDYKLVFFFMCLFVLVGLMEANKTIKMLEDIIILLNPDHEFVVCVVILLVTSVLSAFMDNAPVTVIFLPIVSYLITPVVDGGAGMTTGPLIIAFILGLNLGGNFLPQGSAADMMTLEVARENCVDDLTYKRLFKYGGLFAVIHILVGIGYLAIIIFL